jgi:hypothetical protein
MAGQLLTTLLRNGGSSAGSACQDQICYPHCRRNGALILIIDVATSEPHTGTYFSDDDVKIFWQACSGYKKCFLLFLSTSSFTKAANQGSEDRSSAPLCSYKELVAILPCFERHICRIIAHRSIVFPSDDLYGAVC